MQACMNTLKTFEAVIDPYFVLNAQGARFGKFPL